MTLNTTNLGASTPLPEGGKSLRIPLAALAVVEQMRRVSSRSALRARARNPVLLGAA